MKLSLKLIGILLLLAALTACGGGFQKQCAELEKMVADYETVTASLEQAPLETLKTQLPDLAVKQEMIRSMIGHMDEYVYQKKPAQTQKEVFYAIITRFKNTAIKVRDLDAKSRGVN
jgi:hypothetical protein